MTNQEAFNTVCEHLMEQRCKAKTGTFCVYKNEKGLKCAVGSLIPDEEYKPAMDGKFDLSGAMLYHLLDPKHEFFVPALEKVSEQLLIHLRNVHDNQDVKDWADSLIDVGIKFDLSIPKCVFN